MAQKASEFRQAGGELYVAPRPTRTPPSSSAPGAQSPRINERLAGVPRGRAADRAHSRSEN